MFNKIHFHPKSQCVHVQSTHDIMQPPNTMQRTISSVTILPTNNPTNNNIQPQTQPIPFPLMIFNHKLNHFPTHLSFLLLLHPSQPYLATWLYNITSLTHFIFSRVTTIISWLCQQHLPDISSTTSSKETKSYILQLQPCNTTLHPLQMSLTLTIHNQASKDLLWRKAMDVVYNALLQNHTWELVPSNNTLPWLKLT